MPRSLMIVSPLVEKTLYDRLRKRIAFETAFDLLTQLLEAVSHAQLFFVEVS